MTCNQQLQQKIEEIRSLIRDGYIPTVRIMLCNNGLSWNEITQQYIDSANFGDQISCNHHTFYDGQVAFEYLDYSQRKLVS